MPIKSAIDKKDTVQNIIIKESPIVDSVAIFKEIMGKVSHHKIDFYTFNAKIKAFRNQFRGVQKVDFFLFRLTKLFA